MLKSRCSTEEEVDMKRYMIWSSVALLLVAIGILVARVDGRGRGWGGRGWSHHGPLGYVAHQLNLNETQKSQIKSIWEAERPTVASLVQELASEGKEMDSVTAQGSFDDSKVQAIAARSEEHTSELQSPDHLVCRLLLEKKKHTTTHTTSHPTS